MLATQEILDPRAGLGSRGPPGLRGNTGKQGVKGQTGPGGETGPPGPIGPKGIPGLTGEKGDKGIRGPKGHQGEKGLQGPVGPAGIKGKSGLQGGKGVTGHKGKQGDTGPRGSPGQKGPPGYAGQTGTKGMKGIQGSSGTKGVKGKQGPPGKAGLPGKSSSLSKSEGRPVGREEPSSKDSESSTLLKIQKGQPKESSLSKPDAKLYLDEANDESSSWPQGTKYNPATSCYELSLIQPHFNDGYFYMDPNQGCPSDALRVFCNFTAGGSTCIDPLQSRIIFRWNLEKHQSRTIQWFSQQHGGDKFGYVGMNVVQLRFLRLHSHTSFQRLTLRWTSNNSAMDDTRDFVHLLGDSSQDIHSNHTTVSSKGREVEVVVKVWGSTELHRGDMELLPIRDLGIEMASHWAHESEINAHLGPICFL
ncbi:collagen alpha-3(V) chain-like [Syngnathus scovelli]|uniref:collagen alpha-3(V) chain-like n=1 Tax=Syngnathus scovelli TaxID=161590 RepID=UPI0035C9B636